MVEKRGIGTIISHVVLIAGIAVMCFPIYLAFVAASVSHREIIRPPMPLVPGPHLVDNFVTAITEGTNVGAATMMFNSLVMAMGIAVGKIAISIISAYAIVYFRFPFRMLAFWAIFMTLIPYRVMDPTVFARQSKKHKSISDRTKAPLHALRGMGLPERGIPLDEIGNVKQIVDWIADYRNAALADPVA